VALAFVLDQSPLDSPFFALDGDGSLAIPGRDILIEIEAYDIANARDATLYFASRAYNHPSAPGYYEGRLSQPLNFRRDIYSAQTTGGASRVSFGELRLINNDGALDYMKAYGLVGRRISMLIGSVSQAYDTFEPLVTGKIQQVFFNTSDLTIQLRDRLQDLAGALQANKYAGTNVLPDGLEGAPTDDIKDKPKPLLFGFAFNFAPPCVNTSKLIYQPNDGEISGVLVYDNGALLSVDVDYADENDLLTNAPAAGYYRQLTSEGYFRLGTAPVGDITCTASNRALSDERTAAQLAVQIVTLVPASGDGGVDSTDINFDDVDALDLANPSDIGLWLAGGETYAQVLDALFGSIGVWYGFDRFGQFRMQRLDLPALPYVVTFRIASTSSPMAVDEFNILDYRFMPSNDPEKGLPTFKVSANYAHNYTVQPGNVTAGVVLQARKNFLALADRTEVSENDAVKDNYPLAIEKTVQTYLIGQPDANAEASRLLTIFGTPRDFLEIDTIMTSDLIGLVDIGAVVNVVLPRDGYTTGKIMRVIGMGYNAAQGVVTLACWG
jgi:hypothetical protein